MSTNTQNNAPVSSERAEADERKDFAKWYYREYGKSISPFCKFGHSDWNKTEQKLFKVWAARAALSAPIAAQPDLTQQTLDDVMAGIPARDAEIEALRMEIEAQHAAQANAKQELAPVSDFDLAILSQQYTLPVDIFISAARQVIELYLAAQAQQSLTDADIDRIAAPWLHPDGQANSSDIRAIVRAIHAQQPVSGTDGLADYPTHGMNLGQHIAHVGGRENAQGYVEFGSPMAVHALIQHVLRDFHRQGRVNLAPAQQATDPLQGAADWLVKDCGVSDPAGLANRLGIGYNRASRLVDAARKEQA